MEDLNVMELLEQLKESINTGIDNTSIEILKYRQLISVIGDNEDLKEVKQEFEKTLEKLEESIGKMKDHKLILSAIIKAVETNEENKALVGDLLTILMRR